MLFKGRLDPTGAWTAEEDHLAEMIELFGPIPRDFIKEETCSRSYFDDNGIQEPLPLLPE